MMHTMISYTILNSHLKFSQQKTIRIHDAFSKASKVLEDIFPIYTAVDIVFYDNVFEVNKDSGVGGQTISEHLIMIPLDSAFDFTEEEIFVTICHEFHHKIRLEAFGPMYDLLDSVIAEGLAEQFEKELLPDRQLVTYKNAPLPDHMTQALKDLKKIIDGDDYDYNEWFLGTGTYPKWHGYVLGNYIVDKYTKKYDKKPSELARTGTSEFKSFIDSMLSE